MSDGSLFHRSVILWKKQYFKTLALAYFFFKVRVLSPKMEYEPSGHRKKPYSDFISELVGCRTCGSSNLSKQQNQCNTDSLQKRKQFQLAIRIRAFFNLAVKNQLFDNFRYLKSAVVKLKILDCQHTPAVYLQHVSNRYFACKVLDKMKTSLPSKFVQTQLVFDTVFTRRHVRFVGVPPQ